MKEIKVKESRKFIHSSLPLWNNKAFKWFLVNFPSACLLFPRKGKREVAGGKQPVKLYTTWEEFHPFLYPGYSHKSQTGQFEHSDFMAPYSSSWRQVLFSGDLLPVPPPPYHCWKWGPTQWVKHTVNAVKGSCERSPPLLQVYQNEGLYAPLLAQRFFQCNTMQMMPKELWFISSFPRSVCLPVFPLLSTPLRQFPKYFIYYIQRVTLPR